MDVQSCILTRRSTRKFTDQPVEREILEKALSLATYSPSWKNTQICRYIAIEDPALRQTITDQYCLPGSWNPSIIGHCPLLLVQSFVKGKSGFDTEGNYSTDREEGWQYFDCGVFSQTLSLAFHELGVGSVILGIFDRKGLEKLLNIPEDQEIMSLMAVGYPAVERTAPPRNQVSDILKYI